MATKQTFKSYDEAKEALTQKKEELALAKEERKAFCKENGLSSKDDHSDDPKLGKKFKKLNDPVVKKTAEVEEIKAWMDANKPKKEPKERAVKYEYPAGMTDANEKKKFRAAERRKAASDAKGEGEEKPKKDKKKSKEEAPVEKPAAEKSSKKDKKKDKKEKKADKTESAED